ncbi:MAG: hypothetical protein HY821_19040 [Acidobacteria bacterium]|nr:hypothetical protein [Acidobacteriota bacterium]
MRFAAILLALAGAAWGEEIRGAAVLHSPQRIVTWGDRLLEWDLSGGRPRVLSGKAGFGPGGCAADVDGDGREDLLVQEKPGLGALLWLKAPRWTARAVEAETDFQDCLPFTLGGRRGVLLPHLHAQLRLYLFPGFESKELYSIYTASEQEGLLAHDVDGDGLEDLFLGNYWVRNPGALDVAWRLFAINLFQDTPKAARAAFALWRNGKLFWAESAARQARIAVFTPPQDVKQLWLEQRLAPLDEPKALAAVAEGVLIGHADGVVLEEPAEGGWRRTEIARGFAVLKLFAVDGAVWAVTPSEVRRVYPRK